MTQNKFKEVGLWASVVIVTIAAFFGNYYFQFSPPVKTIIWLVWIVIIGLIVFFTMKGQQLFIFGKEAKNELQKVAWPTKQETIQTTSIVMIMVAATGFILWGIDSGMMWVIAKIAHIG